MPKDCTIRQCGRTMECFQPQRPGELPQRCSPNFLWRHVESLLVIKILVALMGTKDNSNVFLEEYSILYIEVSDYLSTTFSCWCNFQLEHIGQKKMDSKFE